MKSVLTAVLMLLEVAHMRSSSDAVNPAIPNVYSSVILELKFKVFVFSVHNILHMYSIFIDGQSCSPFTLVFSWGNDTVNTEQFFLVLKIKSVNKWINVNFLTERIKHYFLFKYNLKFHLKEFQNRLILLATSLNYYFSN